MLEITLEAIDKLQTLLYEHAGYAASKNAERILDDLRKQAELRGVTATTIPLSIKMAVSAGDDGLHLSVKDVSWQVLQKVSDKDFGDVDWDPHQPNLPGFERDVTPPKPSVIEAKALPAHDDDDDNIKLNAEIESFMGGDAGKKLMVVSRHNLEAFSDANLIPVLAECWDWNNRVMSYKNGRWEAKVVPNTQEALEAADDGHHLVFGADDEITKASQSLLKGFGVGIVSVEMGRTGEFVSVLTLLESGCWRTERDFSNDEDGLLELIRYLHEMLSDDDCLLIKQAVFYGMK